MQKKITNTKGFATVELLIAVAVVLVLGVAGVLVYNQQHKTKAPVSTSTTTNTKAETSKTTDATTKTNKTGYYTIKEWGVEAPYNGDQTLTYAVKADQSNPGVEMAVFNSSQLTQSAQLPDCTADGGGGIIARAQAGTTVYGGDSPTLVQNFPGTKKVGDYYYWYEPNQDSQSCGASTASLQAALQTYVKSLDQNLQVVTQ